MGREQATFTEQIGDEVVEYRVVDPAEFPDGDEMDSTVEDTEATGGD